MLKKNRVYGVAACIVVAIVAMAAILRLGGGSVYEKAVERWEAAGGVPFEQMRPQPVPDEANAAVVYAQAYAAMQPLLTTYRNPDDSLSVFTEEICSDGALVHLVTLAQSAANRPSCVWQSEFFDEGFEAMLPHLGQARDLARLLAEAARCAEQHGDLDAAARALAAGLALGTNAIASEPSLLSALVAIVIHNFITDAIEQTFQDAEIPAGTGLEEALAAIDYQQMLRQALLGEGALGLHAMNTTSDRPPAVAALTGYSFDRDRATYLDIMTRAVEHLELPPGSRDWSMLQEETPRSAILTGMILPALDRAVVNFSAATARTTMASEALRLREYRKRHGTYPDDWPVSHDPISGSRIHYKREGSGFLLWSDASALIDTERAQWRWE
jgi:hypothetical protein